MNSFKKLILVIWILVLTIGSFGFAKASTPYPPPDVTTSDATTLTTSSIKLVPDAPLDLCRITQWRYDVMEVEMPVIQDAVSYWFTGTLAYGVYGWDVRSKVEDALVLYPYVFMHAEMPFDLRGSTYSFYDLTCHARLTNEGFVEIKGPPAYEKYFPWAPHFENYMPMTMWRKDLLH